MAHIIFETGDFSKMFQSCF